MCSLSVCNRVYFNVRDVTSHLNCMFEQTEVVFNDRYVFAALCTQAAVTEGSNS